MDEGNEPDLIRSALAGDPRAFDALYTRHARRCPGGGAACPADGYMSSATVCRGAADGCDVAELCTGASPVCPADLHPCDAACGGCAIGATCDADADCQSAMCYAGQCVGSVNGCDVGSATDVTGSSLTIVTFPNGDLSYAPRCIRVKAGNDVRFDGSFSLHPLQGGEVIGGVPVPASSGPFVPVTDAGTTKTFTPSGPGTFPYYCTVHGASGMNGAVFAVP